MMDNRNGMKPGEKGMQESSGQKGQKGQMMNPGQMKQKSRKSFLLLGVVLIAAVVLLVLYPENREPTYKASRSFFIELIQILPGVMVLMGLFSVWVKNETVIKYLGHRSGISGIALAFFLGMIPTGPLYVAFPLAASLLKKGARTANVVIFLSAWACIKLPQELVEMRFLGLKFMALRLGLTIVLVLFMGLFIEKIGRFGEAAPED